MLKINNHKRNACQNHNKLPHHFVIKKRRDNKCWQGCREKGTFVPCWWACKLMQPQRKTVWEFPQNIKNRTIMQSSNPTSEYKSKGNELAISKR